MGGIILYLLITFLLVKKLLVDLETLCPFGCYTMRSN